jgi:hypothetical protein
MYHYLFIRRERSLIMVLVYTTIPNLGLYGFNFF